MDTTLATANIRLRMWADIIRRRTESGLSVEEWCLRNDVSRDQYFYWLRKVKATALQSTEAEFVEITDPYMSPFSLPDDKAAFVIGDISILVHQGTPDDLMVRMIRAARHAT